MINLKKTLMATGLALAASPFAFSESPVIDHLGGNTTLVRVSGGDRYLMLPVEDSKEDAQINVLADGKLAETIRVRLAESKTDFKVPFDLSPYKGKDVILDVLIPRGRENVRDSKSCVCWNDMEIVDSFSYNNMEQKYRPLYHHAPQWGWMNDPNGMFYKDGVWNLYFQWNPYGSKWQNLSWGHATSTDLVHWQQRPLALAPDGLGLIFSGSSVVDANNTAGFGKNAVISIYTSCGLGDRQVQSLAHSSDNGMTFTTLPSNPIITLDSEARDPNMFWNDETGEWNLVLAHALDHEMLFFTSSDLKNWTLQSSFGKVAAQGGVWECPDLFELPVADTDLKKWVLICNLNPGGPFGGSGVQYFTGDWDGRTFKADTDAAGNVTTKWLDFGKDNYALVSWSDAPEGRRVAIGWMSNWEYAADVPTLQYRSANTLPREIGLFRGADGQIYASSAPSPEVDAIRDKLIVNKSNVKLSSRPAAFQLPTANNGVCEIVIDLEAAGTEPVKMNLTNKAGDIVEMAYNPVEHTVSFDRRKSGVVDFSGNFPAVTVSPTFEKEGKVSLRIFIDRSSIEIFGDDGRFVQTNLVFPNEPYSTLSLSCGGKAKASSLKIYSVK